MFICLCVCIHFLQAFWKWNKARAFNPWQDDIFLLQAISLLLLINNSSNTSQEAPATSSQHSVILILSNYSTVSSMWIFISLERVCNLYLGRFNPHHETPPIEQLPTKLLSSINPIHGLVYIQTNHKIFSISVHLLTNIITIQ